MLLDDSNMNFIENGNGSIIIELKEDSMYICNFTLEIKTPSGFDDATHWKRDYFLYNLPIPNDAEFIIILSSAGKQVEFRFSSSFPTGSVLN